jgi:hypothetical protein
MSEEYAPPRSLRHFRGILARNIIPVNPVLEFRRTALYYVLSEVVAKGDEDFNPSNPGIGQMLYTSEKAYGTLNPEWLPVEG